MGDVAEKGHALDDAMAHLSSLIQRLSSSSSSFSQVETSQKVEASQMNKSLAEKRHEIAQPAPETAVSTQTSSDLDSVLQEEFDKVHLQVGSVISVDNHPVADKLYVCKVEVAKGEIRQVVAGLRKFLPSSELMGKKVCLVLNLKPAKLAGQLSEAMILAAEDKKADGSLDVKLLQPPLESSVGDRIYVEGTSPSAKPVKQLSSKIWEKLSPQLKVKGGIANFSNKSVVTCSGLVTVQGISDGAQIR